MKLFYFLILLIINAVVVRVSPRNKIINNNNIKNCSDGGRDYFDLRYFLKNNNKSQIN